MKNRLVFIGSYTEPIILGTGEPVAGSGDGVTVYRMDDAGHLTRLFAAGKPNPTYLALSPDKRFLYTVNELKEYHEEASAAVSAYAIHPDSGELTFLNRRMTGGGDACCVSGSARTAGFLFEANLPAAALRHIPDFAGRQPRHRRVLYAARQRRGPRGRQARAVLHQVSPDRGKHVLVADLGTDEIRVYGIDWSCGLGYSNAARQQSLLSRATDPAGFVFDRGGRMLYLVTEIGNSVRVYLMTASEPHGFSPVVAYVAKRMRGETISACIKLHPSGAFLYASNRGYDSIASFRVHQDGSLTPLSIMEDGRQNAAGL
ncbi:MAG: beta-propeller fold lactonase family protein [Eubacteriales bacterium]